MFSSTPLLALVGRASGSFEKNTRLFKKCVTAQQTRRQHDELIPFGFFYVGAGKVCINRGREIGGPQEAQSNRSRPGKN